MRLIGKLKTWKGDKGFGFIKPLDGGEDVFVHIKAFQNRSRPQRVGDLLSFDLELDENGRRRAAAVTYNGEKVVTKKPNTPRSISTNKIVVAVLFLFILLALVITRHIPMIIGWIYLILSTIAFFIYWSDKSSAKNNRWRIKEDTLLLWGLLGGWPGALLAQELFRHKSSKTSFQSTFWLFTLINTGVLIWFMLPDGSLWLNQTLMSLNLPFDHSKVIYK